MHDLNVVVGDMLPLECEDLSGPHAGKQSHPHTIPFAMTIDETFDVGIDIRTPVDDKDYQVPFRFTGKLAKLTIKLGPERLTDADREQTRKHLVQTAN